MNNFILAFKRQDKEAARDSVVFGNAIGGAANLLVTLVTQPGGAMFEGTVRVWEGVERANLLLPEKTPPERTPEAKVWKRRPRKRIWSRMTLEGEISRINLYGNSSWCVDLPVAKKYCFCD